MKKLIATLLLGVMTVATVSAANPNSEKTLMKTAKKTAKEMTKDGWQVDGSMPLETMLFKHYQKLADEANSEITGNVEGQTSVTTLNQAQQWATTMAAVSYAKSAGQTMKGRLISEVGAGIAGTASADSFYEGYESLVEKSIQGELKKSFGVYKNKKDGGIDYRAFFVVNTEDAHKARLRAMQMAMVESEFARANAERIAEFVRKGEF